MKPTGREDAKGEKPSATAKTGGQSVDVTSTLWSVAVSTVDTATEILDTGIPISDGEHHRPHLVAHVCFSVSILG